VAQISQVAPAPVAPSYRTLGRSTLEADRRPGEGDPEAAEVAPRDAGLGWPPVNGDRPSDGGPSADVIRLVKLGAGLGLVLALGLLYFGSADVRREVARAMGVLASGDTVAIGEYFLSFGAWGPAVSLLLMVLQAVATPIPTFIITFANGLAFGVAWGWVLSVSGHILAATLCFWLARALGRGPVAALTGRTGLAWADDWLTRRGAYAILLGRLIPGIGFDLLSFAAGLTGIRFGPFIGATTLGVLPQTLVYAYLGQNAPQYMWLLLVVTGVAVVVVSVAAIRRRRAAQASCQDIASPRTIRARRS
jgi:uncharacterized membrane protein YdjX (TVP38/TMEM64 family)